ncbi:MAG: hypothetical protein H0X66_05095 [Verrucomicrobia bacterium]|nr:hypothetical protein [Verrucomicrobiota bacterium]
MQQKRERGVHCIQFVERWKTIGNHETARAEDRKNGCAIPHRLVAAIETSKWLPEETCAQKLSANT